MRASHIFSTRRLQTTGSVNPLQFLVLGAREKGQEDHEGRDRHPPLIGDDQLAWIARTGSSAVSTVQISSPPQFLVLGAWEKSQEDHMRGLDILHSLEMTHWMDRKDWELCCLHSPDLLCTMKLILRQKVKFLPIYGSLGCSHNKNCSLFNLCFRNLYI